MRLIDADALNDYIIAEWQNNVYTNSEMIDIRMLLKHAPTVDAVPVRYGKWEHIGDPKEWDAYICDQCNMGQDEPSEYCPNCGARMDAE